jgi:hypothetical protein
MASNLGGSIQSTYGSIVMKSTRPSEATIEKLKKHYRELCTTHGNPHVARMAQAMETALIFATEETEGWEMEKEPFKMAECLLSDLKPQ